MNCLFHIHSTFSYDGKNSISELQEFCVKNYIECLVMTEHAEDLNEVKMQSYVQTCRTLTSRKCIVVPGLEFGFKEYPSLHLLGVGIESYIGRKDISSTIDEIHDQGGLAIIAHPTRNNHFVPKEIIHKIDGLEIWNASYDSRYLPHHKSLQLYEKIKRKNGSLLAFSGLDMHDMDNYRELMLIVKRKPRDEREFLQYLREGEFINKGKLLSFKSRLEINFFTQHVVSLCRVPLNLIDFMYWKIQGLKKRMSNICSTEGIS